MLGTSSLQENSADKCLPNFD